MRSSFFWDVRRLCWWSVTDVSGKRNESIFKDGLAFEDGIR